MGWFKRWWGIDATDAEAVDADGWTDEVEDDAPVGEMDLDDGMVETAISCAWCLAEQGLPFGEGSHGICDAHAEQLQAQRGRRR